MQFRYDLEKDYYAQAWPTQALPYRQLDPYLTSWLVKPNELFDQKTVVDIGAGEATYTRLTNQFIIYYTYSLDCGMKWHERRTIHPQESRWS